MSKNWVKGPDLGRNIPVESPDGVLRTPMNDVESNMADAPHIYDGRAFGGFSGQETPTIDPSGPRSKGRKLC